MGYLEDQNIKKGPYGSFEMSQNWCYGSVFLPAVSLPLSTCNCKHMDTHARPNTKHKLDHILSHQTSSHCHRRPMGFISASFKTTTLIPTPTLQSQMLSMEEETALAWRIRAYEIPQKNSLIYILCSHLTGSEETQCTVMWSALMLIYLLLLF